MMRYGKRVFAPVLMALVVIGSAVAATPTFHNVAPGKFDPGNTKLVASQWISGIGCPTNAKLSPSGTYTDDACPTGDPGDKENKGPSHGEDRPDAEQRVGVRPVEGRAAADHHTVGLRPAQA
jgi:hypothetical protein